MKSTDIKKIKDMNQETMDSNERNIAASFIVTDILAFLIVVLSVIIAGNKDVDYTASATVIFATYLILNTLLFKLYKNKQSLIKEDINAEINSLDAKIKKAKKYKNQRLYAVINNVCVLYLINLSVLIMINEGYNYQLYGIALSKSLIGAFILISNMSLINGSKEENKLIENLTEMKNKEDRGYVL